MFNIMPKIRKKTNHLSLLLTLIFVFIYIHAHGVTIHWHNVGLASVPYSSFTFTIVSVDQHNP